MKHLDLFSGIGGFALAADTVFGNVEHTFVEIDPFCQEILKKHWPESEIHHDIRQFITDTESRESGEQTKRERRKDTGGGNSKTYPNTERKGWPRKGDNTSGQHGQLDRSWENETPYILTGGFPCQPFSQAGKRKGTSDDRYLWPEMFRVIQLYQPQWVIAENVRGLTTWNEGMVLEQVCTDLESEGYEVQPLIIPACSVNAPHRRERVWIIAHNRQQLWQSGSIEGLEADASERSSSPVSDKRGCCPDWERNWQEVAFATCNDGVDDGIPRKLGNTTISSARWRREALKAYGNAIVPQVAIEIMKSIKLTNKD